MTAHIQIGRRDPKLNGKFMPKKPAVKVGGRNRMERKETTLVSSRPSCLVSSRISRVYEVSSASPRWNAWWRVRRQIWQWD